MGPDFSKETLNRFEWVVLQALDWRLEVATARTFLDLVVAADHRKAAIPDECIRHAREVVDATLKGESCSLGWFGMIERDVHAQTQTCSPLTP
jgi:hypothetical protein